MDHKEIKQFVDRVLPELDEPGTYVPCINQYLTTEEDWGEDKTRIVYCLPVPESAAIQNLGIAILTKIVNEEMGPDYCGSVSYFPEVKMLRRMQKNNVPMFDNWTFHPWKDFDVVGISSFYALQYLNFVPMLKQAGIPHKSEDRINSWEYPIVGMGGIQYVSMETVAPLFDVVFCGEGEEMNKQFLELLRKRKKEGISKREFLLEAAREIQGIYLPWCYEFEYYGPEGDENGNHKLQIKSYHLTEEAKAVGVPEKVLKACIEFRDRPPVDKTFVSNNAGGSMSIGSCYVANSCSNMCSFCQGSQLSLPFREVPEETAIQAARRIIKNTGTKDVGPYCFNCSDLSYINRFTSRMLLEDHIKVALSSERLDTMNDDFVKATIKSGSRSFTVAIEAASPRGRKILNKNLTEEQILRAFEIMFRNGALKIKVYNIASWVGEQEEDRMYYVHLCEKIEELRKKYDAKTQIRLSFTPFQQKPATMLEWAGMENVTVEDDDPYKPIFLKTYNNMMDAVKKVCDYRFRFGTSSTISLVAQILAFGDRRIFPVVEKMADDKRVNYLGGMGIGSSGCDCFMEHLKEQTPFDLRYFIREKDEDELFPWEHLHTGIDKSWLLKMYKKAKAAKNDPLEEEGCLRKPCYESCTVCGVCKSVERGTPEKPKFDSFWPEEVFGKGRKLPQFAYGDHSKDAMNMEEVLDEYIKPQKLRVIRLECDINPKYRYVDSQKLKYRIRRACNRAGIPINTEISCASEKILERAWFSGKELYELQTADKRFQMSEQDIIKAINKEFSDDAMTVTRAEWYSGEVKKLRDNFEYVLYSLTFNKLDFSFTEAKDTIATIASGAEFLVKVKRKSKTKRDAFETVQVNINEYLYKAFARDNEDDTWTLFMALSGDLAIYDAAAALLKTAKRNLYKYPAIIEEYLLKNNSGASLDMFASVCMECGDEIEETIWGEPLDTDYCLEHKYLLQFKHRDIEVQAGYSEEFQDEAQEDEDARFNIGEVTMDEEDTDLEEQVLKKSGNTGV